MLVLLLVAPVSRIAVLEPEDASRRVGRLVALNLSNLDPLRLTPLAIDVGHFLDLEGLLLDEIETRGLLVKAANRALVRRFLANF